MSKIVGFCGSKGVGKNTVSQMFKKLSEKEGYDYIEVSFADNLKRMCSVLFGWNYEDLLGNTEASRKWRETPDLFWSERLGKEITPRKAMQIIGTDLFRDKFGADIWVDSLDVSLENMYKFSRNCIISITDIRFKNEIDFIRRKKGVLIEVKRNTPDWYNTAKQYNILGGVLPEVLKSIHPSEYSYIGVANPDYVIDNNGELKDTQEKVCDIFAQVLSSFKD